MEKDNINLEQDNMPHEQDKRDEALLDRYLHLSRGIAPDVHRVKTLTFLRIAKAKLESSRRFWRGFASVSAAASVALLVTLAIMFHRQNSFVSVEEQTMLLASENTSVDYKTINVPTGERVTFTLADGTQVTANSRTQVLYPETFSGKYRTIKVKGEVMLQVAKDAEHPFIVQSGDFNIKVLGTTFSVNNYDDAAASIVLIEGSVAVGTTTDQNVRMTPGQRVTLNKDNITSLEKVDSQRYTTWIDGYRIVEGETLSTIIPILETMYGIKINCENNVNDKKLYGRLELKSDYRDMLSTLEALLNIKVSYKGTDVILSASENN